MCVCVCVFCSLALSVESQRVQLFVYQPRLSAFSRVIKSTSIVEAGVGWGGGVMETACRGLFHALAHNDVVLLSSSTS